MVITRPYFTDLLAKVGVTRANAEKHSDDLYDALREYKVNTPLRLGHFLAQVLHESMYFQFFKEIASGQAYEGRVDLGNIIPGDGVRYKGRGPIQVTGRYNYTQFQEWLESQGLLYNVLAKPELLEVAPLSWLSAMWYWTAARKSDGRRVDLNVVADQGDTDEVLRRITRLINGGLNGYAHRRAIFVDAMRHIRKIEGYGDDHGRIVWGILPETPAPPLTGQPPAPLPTTAPEAGSQAFFGRILTLLARFFKREEQE